MQIILSLNEQVERWLMRRALTDNVSLDRAVIAVLESNWRQEATEKHSETIVKMMQDFVPSSRFVTLTIAELYTQATGFEGEGIAFEEIKLPFVNSCLKAGSKWRMAEGTTASVTPDPHYEGN